MKLSRGMKIGLVLLIAVVAVLLIPVCLPLSYWIYVIAGPQPGEGKIAERGYTASAPIIDALHRYRTDQGEYPQELEMLVPAYLTVLWTGGDGFNYSYERTATSYVLRFEYNQAGHNICVYSPEAGWNCIGFL